MTREVGLRARSKSIDLPAGRVTPILYLKNGQNSTIGQSLELLLQIGSHIKQVAKKVRT